MPRTERVLDDTMRFRASPTDDSTINEDERTVEAIAMTEDPVLMPDLERMEMVPETLLLDGVRFPKDRKVPLLNSHNRHDANDVLGSATELRVNGKQLETKIQFSSESKSIFKKVQERHLRDVSVGYVIDKKRFVEDGETERISGREFTGPMNVVTSWRLRELSVTPIGADEQAKMRGLQGFTSETVRGSNMSKLLKKTLVERGMSKDFTDDKAREWLVGFGMPEKVDSIDDWVCDNLESIGKKEEVSAQVTVTTNPGFTYSAGTVPVETATIKSQPEKIDVAAIARKAADEATRAAEERVAEIRVVDEKRRTAISSACDLFNIDEKDRAQFMGCESVEEAQGKVLNFLASKRVEAGASIMAFGQSQGEKHSGAIRSAFIERALRGATNDEALIDRTFPKDERHADSRELRNVGPHEMARQCLELEGINTSRLSKGQIAQAALGFYEQAGVRAESGHHFSGMFSNLTLDAINKSLTAGYTEREMTWRRVFRQASSVPDFKQKHVIKFSESPNLPIWDDNKAPDETAFADEKESYGVEARSRIASFSWKLLINDDMDALSRIPFLLGAAANRTVNTVAWAEITANANLVDGQALFLATPTGNRNKANLLTGAATPTVATIGNMRQLMRLQVGLNDRENAVSSTILNLQPVTIVVPAAIETETEQLLQSTADPTTNLSSGVFNPFRSLQLVVEPLLDDNSATAWYLFASTSQIDTVEVSFLEGQETPATNSWTDDATMARMYMIVQSYAAKAIDFRGMVKHDGA